MHLFNTANYEERPFSIFALDEQSTTGDANEFGGQIKQIKFSPDGKYILLGTTNNVITLIDSFEGKLKHKFTGN